MEQNSKLLDYIKSKGLTVQGFALKIGIQPSQIQKIVDNPKINLTLDTVRRIYSETERIYGEGLGVHDYLDIN